MNTDNLIFGRNSVGELLKSGRSINKILFAKGKLDGSVQKIFADAKNSGTVVEFVEREKLDKIAGGKNHQGVAAYAAAIQYSTVEEIMEYAESKNEAPFIVLLDEIEDPQNLGAILRTCDAVGVHGVIIPKRRNAPINSTVAKTSAGAVEYVKIAKVTNVAQTLKELKKLNLTIVGSDMTGEIEFTKADLTGGICFVIGNEGKGMRRLTRENCDLLVNIPMIGKINSLNASVAGAVIMYEIFRQRRK